MPNNKTNPIKEAFVKIHTKHRKVKDSINKETGKKVYIVFNVLTILLFLLVMPILFTVMTTLLVSAGGFITTLAYRITFYLIWLLLIILFSIRTFFSEYK